MSIVIYYKKKGGRVFNCGQAVKDGWGIEWTDLEGLVGLKLQDRTKPKHQVEISGAGDMMGCYTVSFQEGGWLALDHAIEQFKLMKQ